MKLNDFKEKLFVEGEKFGFTDLELYYEKNDSLLISLYEGEVDQYEPASVQGASVRGLYKGKTGYAYTEKIDEEAINYLLKNAAENAEVVETDPEELFTEEAEYENKEFYTPELENVTPEDMIGFLQDVEKKVLAYDPRVSKISGVAMKNITAENAVYNNQSMDLSERNNFLMMSVSLLVKENDELKSGSHFKIYKDFKDLDASEVAKKAVEDGLSFLGEKSYENKSYPVVLKNSAAAQLLGTFTSSFSAQSVHDGQSRLKEKLGKVIGAANVTLIDNPFLAEGVASATFDSEGVPKKEYTVVKDGVLETYFHNLKTAHKDGVESTGHAYRGSYKGAIDISPSNFYVAPADVSYEVLFADIDEGIVITNLAGLHSGANDISGDFSLAADGYYIKDGKIVGPTRQMTVAGNFFDVLKDVEAIGKDLEFSPMGSSGYIGSPSLKIKSLAVTID